jgi:hypothetical protein
MHAVEITVGVGIGFSIFVSQRQTLYGKQYERIHTAIHKFGKRCV